jgi:hypothetical protein
LIENHDGSFILRLVPTEADVSACTYRLRLLVADSSTPAMLDAETISLRFYQYTNLLPVVKR